ncbi:MAG: nicotinate (nicotinamide) nucleotide adenylyltransferase [Bacteroidales bacterium]
MSGNQRTAGLFFGSFNPVHIGHLAIANYFQQFTDLDEVWFVVSPQNPLKGRSGLLDPWLRLEMLHLAVDSFPGFRVTDIELYLPQPSYTTVTLAHLGEQFPHYRFALIMGSDNLPTLHKWYNYEVITGNYPIYVYPRPGTPVISIPGAEIISTEAPMMEISSSFIRKAIRDEKDISFFLPEKVREYIEKEQLYR